MFTSSLLFTILLNCIFASLHHPCFGQIERLWDPSKWLPTREAPVSTLWICIFYPPTIFQISEIPIYMLMSMMERCHIHWIQSVFQNNTVICFEIRKTTRQTERSRHIIGTITGFNRRGIYLLECRVMK